MDADDTIGGAAQLRGGKLSGAREGFPFAAAAAGPGHRHRGQPARHRAQPGRGARQSLGLAELRRRAPRRKWRKSPNCNNRPAKTPKTADTHDDDAIIGMMITIDTLKMVAIILCKTAPTK